jgi:hypothetical protein
MRVRQMTNRRLVLIVLTYLAFFASILEPVQPTSELENTYRSIKSSFTGIPDAPLDIGSDQEFCRAFYQSNVKMDIDFTITVTKLSKRYTNIFQTDDLNSGFRIEIGQDGELTAFVQSPDGGGPEKVLSVLAYGVVKQKTLTRVHVSVYMNTLTVKIDDGAVASQQGNFQPSCNHVLFGGGYDNSRTTIGEVTAVVRIQTSGKTVTTFGFPMQTRGIARILFTLLLVGLIWEYRREIFALNN